MDVRIGVIQSSREIDIELPDDIDGDAIRADIDSAMGGDASMIWLTDHKGRRFGVPSDKLAYVEIGGPDEGRRIGFGA